MKDNQYLDDLLRRIRNSDPSAKDDFDEFLYSRVSTRMVKYVLRKYGSTLDADDARDVVHNTLVIMLVKVSQYRGPNAVGWLYSIARSEASKMVKAKKRIAFSFDDPAKDDGNDSVPERSSQLSDLNWEGGESVEERAINSGFLSLFKSQANQLSNEELDILNLRYDKNLTFEDIGKRKNRTKVRAKQKHDGIIAKIRSFLRLD